jgi:hypothetical protein
MSTEVKKKRDKRGQTNNTLDICWDCNLKAYCSARIIVERVT